MRTLSCQNSGRPCAKTSFKSTLLLLLFSFCWLAGAHAQNILRIRSGGGALKDSDGRTWVGDQFFSGGFTYAAPHSISNTSNPFLYQTERAGAFAYHIPAAPGRYRVTLHFAEIFFKAAGKRIFSVTAEGVAVVSSLDLVGAAGPDVAYQRVFEVETGDGFLDLEFLPVLENPKVSGIEIDLLRDGAPPALSVNAGASQTLQPNSPVATLSATVTGLPPGGYPEWSAGWRQVEGPASALIESPGSAASAVSLPAPGQYVFRFSVTAGTANASGTTSILLPGNTDGQDPVRIRAGGKAYTDSHAQKWMADSFYTGGGVFDVNGAIHSTSDPTLYQSERFGSFGYHVPVRNGIYRVRLHFAELWFQKPSARIFSVSAEGQPLLPSLDIISTAGFMTATILEKTVRVSDGVFDLVFAPIVENPKVSALEILPLALDPPPLGINLGEDLQIQLPVNAVSVGAQITNPVSGGSLSACTWSQVSGPTPATIVPGPGPGAAITFSAPGSYRFRAEVHNASQSVSAEIAVLVKAEVLPPLGVSAPPETQAGPVPVDAALQAKVVGIPSFGPAQWSGVWEQTAGPALARISEPTSPSATVTLTEPGPYAFRYTATFGTLTASASTLVRAVGEVSGQAPIRVHSGGVAFTDSKGNTWGPDAFFSGGAVFNVLDSVQGTGDPGLYQTERFGSFSYNIPLRNGLYELRLHFAELWFKKVGSRVFNVAAEGKVILPMVDLFKSTGYFKASISSSLVRVADGVLNIDFMPWTEQPKVSAVEVLPLALDPMPLGVKVGEDRQLQLPSDTIVAEAQPTGGTSPIAAVTCLWSQVGGPDGAHILTPAALTSEIHFHEPGAYRFRATLQSGGASTFAEFSVKVLPPPDRPGVIRIRCGGPAYTDSLNHVWGADSFFSGGFSYAATGGVSGTDDPGLYLSERAGKQLSYKIPVPNGDYTVRIHLAEIYWKQPMKRMFSATVEGVEAFSNLDLFSAVGANAACVRECTATVADGAIDINFISQIDYAKVSGIEIIPALKTDHLLHVVIRAPDNVVDYSGAGSVLIPLVGSASHTHEFGQKLARFEWRENGALISNDADFGVSASIGAHVYELTIYDDKIPPASLKDSIALNVLPASAVSGVYASYFEPASAHTKPLPAAFAEVLQGFKLESLGNGVGSSGMASASVLLEGVWTPPKAGTYAPALPANISGTVSLDGLPWTGPKDLSAGPHTVAWLVASITNKSLPIELTWTRSDGGAGVFSGLSHDETKLPPQINSMSKEGPAVGGDTVEIKGLGFFPSTGVSVLWGNKRLSNEILQVSPTLIQVVTPPGAGTVSVQVQTPQGMSTPVSYQYQEGTAPVQFVTRNIFPMTCPTQAAWGPDGRLYVASLYGSVTALELDEDYNVLRSQVIPGVQDVDNSDVLGIGFSPWEPASAFKIYLGHAKLFITDGLTGVRPAPYIGQVSALASPLFRPVPLITGLPSSNHDHGVNGITFDNRGQLYVPQGGNTNAGVASYNLGGFDESPLSESVIVASIRDPGFDGRVSYVDARTGAASTDQNDGAYANLRASPGIRIFASGFRNAFDIVWATNGHLYGTDNGPNVGFGKASFTATTESGDPGTMDKVVLLARGHYYGHANRNRGRFDPRENRYRYPWEVTGPELYTQPLAELPSSKDGIDEYRATAFGGALRGSLLVQEWSGSLSALKLSPDGRQVQSIIEQVFGTQRALDVVCGPGGAIVGVDYSGSQINVSLPDDKAATGMVAYDIFPWRAPASGGFTFVIGGKRFGSLADTTVRFGNHTATLTSVSSKRIKGLVPTVANPSAGFLPVQVSSGGSVSTIPDAFRFLLEPGRGTGTWREELPPPVAPGECAAASVGGIHYVLSADANTLAGFDTATGEWTSDFPSPPRLVRHPVMVSAGSEIVLLGDVAGSSSWVVQVYSPFSRTWRQAAAGPWCTLKPAAAALGRRVYVCGGELAGAPSSLAAVFDVDQNQWTALTQSPVPLMEGAASTDGAKIWVFGGAPNAVDLGVQCLDPADGTWSGMGAGSAQATPNRLGARAVFYDGEFYLFGGRLASGEALQRIDALMPGTLKWRSEIPMPEGVWGLGVIADENEIFLVGGVNQKAAPRAARVLIR